MIPPAVLAAYPPEVRDCTWTLLPSGGGLNGGRVWRGDLNGEPLFALKRWPKALTPERMQQVHERMRTANALEFAPRLVITHSGGTIVVHAGHCWDAAAWIHGTPDLLDRPSAPQLAVAGQALAELHRVWSPAPGEVAPSPAVARRLKLFSEWENARFRFDGPPGEVAELLAAHEVVQVRLPAARAELLRVANLRGRVVGIHGDFWPENVLFTAAKVSAVLDYGNVAFDHPEVDLGRLFADVPGADRRMVLAAVEAHNAVAPFDLSASLVELLATTGRLGSLANWHLRLNAGSPDAGLLAAALPRIRRLVSLLAAG
jgi:Ser/Thr protein kinase RdoA (MazF antagonist)